MSLWNVKDRTRPVRIAASAARSDAQWITLSPDGRTLAPGGLARRRGPCGTWPTAPARSGLAALPTSEMLWAIGVQPGRGHLGHGRGRGDHDPVGHHRPDPARTAGQRHRGESLLGDGSRVQPGRTHTVREQRGRRRIRPDRPGRSGPAPRTARRRDLTDGPQPGRKDRWSAGATTAVCCSTTCRSKPALRPESRRRAPGAPAPRRRGRSAGRPGRRRRPGPPADAAYRPCRLGGVQPRTGAWLAAADMHGTALVWDMIVPATPLACHPGAGPRRDQRRGIQPGRRDAGHRRQLRDGDHVGRGHPVAPRTLSPRSPSPAEQSRATALRPDGRALIAAAADGTAKVWDVTRPRPSRPGASLDPRRAVHERWRSARTTARWRPPETGS